MPTNDKSLERIESHIQKLNLELTPSTVDARKALLDQVIWKLDSEGITLADSDREKCELYIAGHISMRELSRYLLKD